MEFFNKIGNAFANFGSGNSLYGDQQQMNLLRNSANPEDMQKLQQFKRQGFQNLADVMGVIGAQGDPQRMALAQNKIRQRKIDEENARAKAEQKAAYDRQYNLLSEDQKRIVDRQNAGIKLNNKGSLPSSIKEFEYSLTNPDYAKFMEDRKSDTNINTGISGFQKSAVDAYNNVQAEAKDARVINTSLDTLDNLLDKGVNTGFGSGFGLSLQRIGQSLVGEDYKVGDIAGREAFQAETTKLILPLVKQLGVNPTDKDLDFVKTGAVELSKSEAGNKIMIAGLRLSQERKLDESNFDNQFYLKNPQATIFERNNSFQKHMDANPELYTSITLQQAYDNLLLNQATNVISTDDASPF